MKFELSLDEQDFLNQMLFFASKSKQIKKRRIMNAVFVPGILVIASVVCYFNQNYFLTWTYLFLSILVAIFYPFYQRARYRKFYLKHIRSEFGNQVQQVFQIEFQEDYLFTKDETGESKIYLSDLEHIYETTDYFYLKFKTAEVQMVPKKQVALEEFVGVISGIISRHHIGFSKDLNWKWK